MGGYIGNNVILYILLFPLLAIEIIRNKHKEFLFVFIYCFAFLLFWFKSTQMIRFIYPGFAIGRMFFS